MYCLFVLEHIWVSLPFYTTTRPYPNRCTSTRHSVIINVHITFIDFASNVYHKLINIYIVPIGILLKIV